MFVSVVIPARNEEKRIAACLSSLAAQTFAKDQFEVIVVDHGSTDHTGEAALAFCDRLSLTVLRKRGGTIAAARNFGAEAAQGEILAFLDADCQAPSHWLSRSLEKAPGAGAIWGAHYLLNEDATWVAGVWNTYQARAIDGETSFIPSSNLFVRSQVFWDLGGFNPEVITSEDVDLCVRARIAGMPVTAFAELAVCHGHSPRSLLEFYRKNRWHGISVLPNFIRNLPSMTHLPLLAISVCTLLTFWSLLGSIVLSILGAAAVKWPMVCLAAQVGPPVMCAFWKTKAKPVKAAFLLSVLYETYFLSRAAALLRGGEQLRRALRDFARTHLSMRELWTNRRT